MATIAFSDTTNKSGAIQLCEFYTSLGDAAISGNTVLLKQFTALLNRAGSEVWHILFSLNNGWIYDDSNQTDLPQAIQNLVASIAKYALPTGTLAVKRIEVLDNSGAYKQLDTVRMEEVALSIDEYYKTDELPKFYRLIGNTIELFPAPSAAATTLTNGLKVYFDRSSVAFASTDTTKTFGFASEYHDIPVRKASIEWLKVNKPGETMAALIQDDLRRMADLQEYESLKWKDRKPSLATNNPRQSFR